MAGDQQSANQGATGGMQNAPSAIDEEHPIVLQRSAGFDGSIRERLQDDPTDCDAKVDEASDESMDASDPVAISQPGSNTEPAPSSGFQE